MILSSCHMITGAPKFQWAPVGGSVGGGGGVWVDQAPHCPSFALFGFNSSAEEAEVDG